MRAGKHATVVAFSHGVGLALKAAELLALEGVEVEVVDLRTLRPLDMPLVLGLGAENRTLRDRRGGMAAIGDGAEICARIVEEAFDDLDAGVRRVTGKDVPMPYAANLEKLALPQAEDVVAAVKAVLYMAD